MRLTAESLLRAVQPSWSAAMKSLLFVRVPLEYSRLSSAHPEPRVTALTTGFC